MVIVCVYGIYTHTINLSNVSELVLHLWQLFDWCCPHPTPPRLPAKTMVISALIIYHPDWSVTDYSWAASCQELSKAFFPFLFCKIPSMILRFLNLSVLTRLHIASLGPNPIIFMLVNNRRLKETGKPYCAVPIRADSLPSLSGAKRSWLRISLLAFFSPLAFYFRLLFYFWIWMAMFNCLTYGAMRFCVGFVG